MPSTVHVRVLRLCAKQGVRYVVMGGQPCFQRSHISAFWLSE